MRSSAAHFDKHHGGVAFGLCPSGTTLLAVVPPARTLFPSTVNLITLKNFSAVGWPSGGADLQSNAQCSQRRMKRR